MTKTEIWNGYEIRFVEKEPGEWWAVLADLTKALDLTAKGVRQRLEDEVISNYLIPDSLGRKQEMLIVNEYGIYETVFESRKKEAKEFKRWVFGVIKALRESTGLEGFQVFRMLDKEHQKEAMKQLHTSFETPKKVNYIKANTIANKAISTKHGHPKMVKKKDMSPGMLVERQPILDDAVRLMSVSEEFGLGVSVSEEIYKKYLQ